VLLFRRFGVVSPMTFTGRLSRPAASEPNEPLVRHSSVGEIDAIAAQWNTLLTQSPELRRSHGQAAVGTYDAVPWQILVSGGKDTPNEPGRDRVDVAVGAHEALRYRPDSLHDAILA